MFLSHQGRLWKDRFFARTTVVKGIADRLDFEYW